MPLDYGRMEKALELVEGAVDKGIFPCASLAVGHANGIYKQAAYGSRCLQPEVLPVSEGTLFDLASLTKVIATVTLFVRFMEEGLVSARDRVSEHLPGFIGEGKEEVTLLNLLTHTSGLPSHLPFYELCSGYDEAIDYICGLKLEYKPGTKIIYSDLGFILLGRILEGIGGCRLDRLCSEYVFAPLGMAHTGFLPQSSNIAATEIDNSTGKPLIGTVHDGNARLFGGISGHAGLFSDVSDISRFAAMLVNKGRLNGKQFMSLQAFNAMTANYTPWLNEDRGYGWCIKTNRLNSMPSYASSGGELISCGAFGHTGFTGTSLWVDAEKDIFVVLLTNRVHPTRESSGILRFRRLFHNAVFSALR